MLLEFIDIGTDSGDMLRKNEEAVAVLLVFVTFCHNTKMCETVVKGLIPYLFKAMLYSTKC